jgi:hypothetical protein
LHPDGLFFDPAPSRHRAGIDPVGSPPLPVHGASARMTLPIAFIAIGLFGESRDDVCLYKKKMKRFGIE